MGVLITRIIPRLGYWPVRFWIGPPLNYERIYREVEEDHRKIRKV